MSKNGKKCIEKFISKKKDEIEAVNENFFGDVVSVAQASGQLKEALEKVDACLVNVNLKKPPSLAIGMSPQNSFFCNVV